MNVDTVTLDRLTPEDVAKARQVLLTLVRNGEAVGSWTHKSEVFMTGCTVHVRYGKPAVVVVDGKGSSNEFVKVLLESPDILWTLLALLFAVDDHDMAALLEEARS